MKIDQTIHNLRVEKGFTQEQLAEMLGVSMQAVSKWERGNAYPDITLLPELAEIFGCSVDRLLGYDRRSQKSVDGIIAEADRLRKEQRHDDAEALIAQMLARYPDNTQLMFELGQHKLSNTRWKTNADRRRMHNEAAELFRCVVQHETDDSRRTWALHYLANIHMALGEYDAASEYNAKLGGSVHRIYPQVTEAVIELQRNPGDKAAHMAKSKLYGCILEYSLMFSWYVSYLSSSGNYDEVIRECTRTARIYEEFTDCGWILNDLSCCLEMTALAYASKGEYESCLDHLEKAAEYAACYDTQDWGMTFKAYDDAEKRAEPGERASSKSMLAALNSRERKVYDPIRETDRFKRIVEMLRAE